MRKIVFPIHFKLIGFTLALMAASLGFYVYYAVDLFKSDKLAYVFETVSSQNEQVGQSLSYKLENAFAATNLLQEAKFSSSMAKEIFKQNPQLLGSLGFKEDALESSIFSKRLEGVDTEQFRKFLRSKMLGDKGMDVVVFQERSFFLVWNKASLSFWEPGYLSGAFPESALYTYHLLINGKDIMGSGDSALAQTVREKDRIQQTFVFTPSDGSRLIVAIEPLVEGNSVVVTAADYQKAIEASLRLREKSLYFGMFTAGIVIFLVLLFSRFFTRPIDKLFKASQKFTQRDFNYRVKLSTGDELGALGESFNHMAAEIGHYMEEMKEKNRLENELKTAQLVQESFFPKDSISGKNLELQAFYRPASECGGDWWGYLETEENEIVIMIDVTGHGTAAALVTAVVHNSLTALKYIGDKDPAFLSSPARIMGYLNESLLSVDVDLFATAFVMSIEKSGSKIRYCNASHNPPYRIPAKENLQKGDFVPLMESLGARLGESVESTYIDVEFERAAQEKLILYTDGILEMEDPQAKAYGSRKFIKKLIEGFSLAPSDLVSSVIADAFAFVGERDPKDDITLICLELK